MKRFLLLFVSFILIVSCKKKLTTDESESISKEDKTVENVSQYAVRDWVLGYSDIDEVGKKYSDVKNGYYWLNIGNKVTVIDEIKKNDTVYYKSKLPDDSVYWVDNTVLSEKLITIIKDDTFTYTMPDENYSSLIRLQRGDYGFVTEEKNNYLRVYFYGYRTKEGEERTSKNWIGELWIRDGYSDNIDLARQSYYLYMAYRSELVNKDYSTALEMIEKAEDLSKTEYNELTDVLSNYKEKIMASTESSDEVDSKNSDTENEGESE